MKDRWLIYCSLAISIAALAYAAWVHQHSQQMARAALREREKEIVQTLAPGVREIYASMGMTNKVPQDVSTLDELFKPTFEMVSNLSGDNAINQTVGTNRVK